MNVHDLIAGLACAGAAAVVLPGVDGAGWLGARAFRECACMNLSTRSFCPFTLLRPERHRPLLCGTNWMLPLQVRMGGLESHATSTRLESTVRPTDETWTS